LLLNVYAASILLTEPSIFPFSFLIVVTSENELYASKIMLLSLSEYIVLSLFPTLTLILYVPVVPRTLLLISAISLDNERSLSFNGIFYVH
jgi:hypothetical protein